MDINNFKNIVNLKEHRISTKFLGTLIIILVFILVISASFMFKSIINENDSLAREKAYSKYSQQLIDASNYLTTNVYYYVVSGDEQYYNDYYTELNVTKSREDAVNNLLNLGVTDFEESTITGTLDLSNELAQIEINSFELMKNGKIDEARELIFSETYELYKNKINSNYANLQNGIDERTTKETQSILFITKLTFIVSIIACIGIAFATILLILTLYRIKRESDIDILTGLLNRNGYKEKINKLIDAEPDKYGALIFCDIDNLKFINECYGHNNGDRYIQSTASIFKEFSEYKSVIARPSGDEFHIYIHGFDTEDDLISAIDTKMKKLRNSYFVTTLHIEEKIRFSTGISIYLRDTTKLDELIKFSDYAMYKMKKNSKGEVAYYDKTTLDKTMFLARNSGCLDELLEKELLDFALQPIVYSDTFEIYGYEALMRPQLDIISSPFLLLELAKSESKLDKVERLVLKKMFSKINTNHNTLSNYKIFINSIADQVLSDTEFNDYIKTYPNVLESVVIEVTEQEYIDEKVLKNKTAKFKEFGALIALDDYGSGYSNDYSLLSGIYDIIKIDMNIIRNVDTDTKRQEIVKSIIKISEINGYKILAEGVETASEAIILRDFGVHYMQGYFFGKPNLEILGIEDKAKELREKLQINNS
ncbi:MAG: EAL domain-containing protein [Lachnospirales bacterium]